jgi:tetratricopeptide (TPR) repeat protein
VAYQLKRDFAKALEQGRRAIAIYPKNVPQRNNVGLFAMYAGDFQAAAREQRAVLEINPRFPSAYAGLALAQLASGQAAAARATWQKLVELGSAGASMAAIGLADLALFEGKAAEARTLLEEAIEADLKAEDPDSAAYKMTLLAEVHQAEGRRDRAVAAALRARQTSRAEAVSYCAGRVWVEAGDARSAAALAEELERSLEAEPRMYGHLLRGELDLRRGAPREALERFKQAQVLSDSWLSRYGQGRAYLAAGAFAEAHGQLEACLRRRGEATDLFLNIWPTYRFLPPVHYELGRTEEGLKSPEAVRAFEAFVEIKKDGADPRLEDARKRLGPR